MLGDTSHSCSESLTSMTNSRLRKRRRNSILYVACCIVCLTVVILSLMQWIGVATTLPAVESYFPGYVQPGGTQGHAFFASGSGPVPLAGTTNNNCSSFMLESASLSMFPGVPNNRRRQRAGARVISPIITDDHGSVWSVTATALRPLSANLQPDTLGTELWVSRRSKLEQTAPTRHINLLQTVLDESASLKAQVNASNWDATVITPDAALSREPFQAISRLAMEPSSRSPIVIIRGSVEASAGYGDTPQAPVPAPVSMLALISSTAADANSDAAALLSCADSINFIAEENLVSRAVPSAACISSISPAISGSSGRSPPGPGAEQANIADPLWFRPVELLVEPCVHIGTGQTSSPTLSQCDLTDTDVATATNTCPYVPSSTMSNSELPATASYTNVYVMGPRHNTLEIRHYQVIMTRSDCRDRWQPVHLFHNTKAWHVLASSNVPLFWPLPIAQIASMAMFNDTEMLTVSAPLIKPPHADEAVVQGNRIPPFEIYGVNITSGVSWKLSDAMPNITGVYSNALIDSGGSVWVALAEQVRQAGPGANQSKTQPASVEYKVISIRSRTGAIGRTDALGLLRPRRPSMSLIHPTLQLAVSTSFLALCEQVWPTFVNMTRVEQGWAPPGSRRPPITTGIGWSAFLFDDGSQVFAEGADDDDQEVGCIGEMVATQNSIFAIIANTTLELDTRAQVVMESGLMHRDLTPSDSVRLPNKANDRSDSNGSMIHTNRDGKRKLGGTLNLFQEVDVGLRGMRLFSSEEGVVVLDALEFGVIQYPASWVPDATGVSLSRDAEFTDITPAGYAGSSRVSLALLEQRGVVAQRQKAAVSSESGMQSPWSNISVTSSTEGQQCHALQADQLVKTYTFLTVGLVLSMLFRLIAGWVWATVFTVAELPAAPEKQVWIDMVKESMTPAKLETLFAPRFKIGICCGGKFHCKRMDHHCKLRCCTIGFRSPGNTEPAKMQLSDYNRHLETLGLSNSRRAHRSDMESPHGGVVQHTGSVLVTRAQFNGRAVTRFGSIVDVAPRPIVRMRCNPKSVKSIDVSTGTVFDGISPAGCVCCCMDCRLAVDPETLVQTRGPRTDASPWHIVTYFHFLVAFVVLVWTSVQSMDAIHEFSEQIRDPRTFFYHFLVNAPADGSNGCQSSLNAACFCDQGVAYDEEGHTDLEASRWENPWAAHAALGMSIGSQCACSAAETACGLSCRYVLKATGNCAAQAFAYLCSCGVNECNVTSLSVSTASESASEALKTGIRTCATKYAIYSQLCLASVFVMIITVIFAMYCQVDLSTRRNRRNESHNNKLQFGPTNQSTAKRSSGAVKTGDVGSDSSTRVPGRAPPFAELNHASTHSRGKAPSGTDKGGYYGALDDDSKASYDGVVVRTSGAAAAGDKEQEDDDDDDDEEEEDDGDTRSKSRHQHHRSSKNKSHQHVLHRVKVWQDEILSETIGSPLTLFDSDDLEEVRSKSRFSKARRDIARLFLLNLPQFSKQELEDEAKRTTQGEAHLRELEDGRDVERMSSVVDQRILRDAYRGPGSDTALFDTSMSSTNQSFSFGSSSSRVGMSMGMSTTTTAGPGNTTVVNPESDNEILQSLQSDDPSRYRCLLLSGLFLTGCAFLFALAYLLGHGYYATGRTCTQVETSADLPVPSTILPERSDLLKNIEACTLSQEWRDTDPEGTALRTVKVSFLATVVALLVLALDPLALALQLCCRMRNAWAAHPDRLAVRLLFSKPLGCGDGISLVMSAPILAIGALATCCNAAKAIRLEHASRSRGSNRSILTGLGSSDEGEDVQNVVSEPSLLASAHGAARTSRSASATGISSARRSGDLVGSEEDPMATPEILLSESWIEQAYEEEDEHKDRDEVRPHKPLSFELATDDWGGTVVFCCSPQSECTAFFIPFNKTQVCLCGCMTVICCFQSQRQGVSAHEPYAMARELATRLPFGKIK